MDALNVNSGNITEFGNENIEETNFDGQLRKALQVVKTNENGFVKYGVKAMCDIGWLGCFAMTVLLFPFGIYFAIPLGFVFSLAFVAEKKQKAKYFLPLIAFLYLTQIILAAVFFTELFMEDSEFPPMYAFSLWILTAAAYLFFVYCYRFVKKERNYTVTRIDRDIIFVE